MHEHGTAASSRGASAALAALLCVALAFLPAAGALAQSRDTLELAMIEPQVGAVLPLHLVFNDYQGRPVQLAELTGERPTIVCLVYFQCPMLCKLSADGLVRAAASIRENVGEQFNIAFISFDPRDTSEQAARARTQALRQYSRESNGIGWYFLTGSPTAIQELTDRVGFRYAWDEQTGQFSHVSGLVIVAADGTITEYLDGVHFAPNELSSALQRAQQGEQRPREATTFIRCYLYDPTTGRFGAIIQWTIRTLGILTVLGIVLLVVRLTLQPPVTTSEA